MEAVTGFWMDLICVLQHHMEEYLYAGSSRLEAPELTGVCSCRKVNGLRRCIPILVSSTSKVENFVGGLKIEVDSNEQETAEWLCKGKLTCRNRV